MTELAELLTGPTARHALACRDIAEVYRILRDAGISQASIALATQQRESEVSEILAGRRVQSVAVLERIVDGLGVPRGGMGLAYTPDVAPVHQEIQTEGTSDDNLLRHAAIVLCGSPVFGAANPIRVQHTPTPIPSRIGLADIDWVTATTDRLSQLVGDLGGIPMTAVLTAHSRVSERLLEATMREPIRQRLLIALADAHRAAGAAAYGAGLRDLARQHCSRGMDCAGAGGELQRAALCLNILGSMELRFEPNEALKLFQLGLAAAPTSLLRAMLEYNCAWALGLLGQAADALVALRRARDTYQVASDEPRIFKHFATTLPHLEGCAYLALGHFDRAAAVLSAAVTGASHTVGCSVDNFGHLAAAQLRCGELRAGLHTAQQAISMAKGLRSVSVLARLAPLQEAAAARRDSACQDLASELATLRSAA